MKKSPTNPVKGEILSSSQLEPGEISERNVVALSTLVYLIQL